MGKPDCEEVRCYLPKDTRETIIDRLVQTFIDRESDVEDEMILKSILRRGHPGYETVSDDKLIELILNT